MKLYLAHLPSDFSFYSGIIENVKYGLVSYWYAKSSKQVDHTIFDDFLLDSGAFTFMNTFKHTPRKEEMLAYLEGYIQYINEKGINHFFELDVDSIYGYDFVLEMRKTLENRTGKQCVPVWHHSRGKDEFIRMCKEYEYAAIGGIVTREKIAEHKDAFVHLNRLAHKYGCKLHGLGFTPTQGLEDYGFYSTDSTSWTSGFRFGQAHFFNGKGITVSRRKGFRVSKGKELDIHNLKQWILYQEYLDSKRGIY